MKPLFYSTIAALLTLLAAAEVTLRDYEDGDKYPDDIMAHICKHKQGIPCHVAVNSTKGPHSVVGYIVMDIPFVFDADLERGIRKSMKYPQQKGSFGYIELVEVDQASQGSGIGTALLKYALERGEATAGTLAMALRVSQDNVRAIRLYEKLHFVKVMSVRLRMDLYAYDYGLHNMESEADGSFDHVLT
ncbi:hypothetical protein FOL47_006723 [Perkinsus chesapeaki]|uniref:N-acetyltransferase domain-containing protein n=1 Tax=Perkinsus chesapeaki TaxID=330153 RepID=A0A7J6MWZ4_PERCH|nr:hypothetical protein FOL47_006723 [Perkinsus chesapeaki]